MTQLITGTEVVYLSFPEAASKLEIGNSTFSGLLADHPDISEKYVSKVVHNGRMRKVITSEGLTVLMGVKGVNGKNRDTRRIRQAKQKIVETAIAAVAQPNDPILANLQQMMAIRQQQLDQGARLDVLERRLEEVKMLAIEAPPADLVTSQREFLNDRVRFFCNSTEMTYGYVWNKLHTYIGKKSVNDYKFDDYKPAIRYLKQLYALSKIEWN